MADLAYTDPTDALGMCLISATKYATEHGWGLVRVTGLTYPGREHWAAVTFTEDLDQTTVVDLTMRQFRADRPARWEGDLDEWLDDMTENLNDHLAYALYPTGQHPHDNPVYEDDWIREDITPGPIHRPWANP